MEPRYSDVVDVLNAYCEGLYHSDTGLLRNAFHPDAQCYTASGGTLLQLDMNSYIQVVEAWTPPAITGEAYRFRIDFIEFAGPVTAFARIRNSMLSMDFVDFLSLIWVDGAWRIIANVFHYHARRRTRNKPPGLTDAEKSAADEHAGNF